jgi:hypothetical protein
VPRTRTVRHYCGGTGTKNSKQSLPGLPERRRKKADGGRKDDVPVIGVDGVADVYVEGPVGAQQQLVGGLVHPHRRHLCSCDRATSCRWRNPIPTATTGRREEDEEETRKGGGGIRGTVVGVENGDGSVADVWVARGKQQKRAAIIRGRNRLDSALSVHARLAARRRCVHAHLAESEGERWRQALYTFGAYLRKKFCFSFLFAEAVFCIFFLCIAILTRRTRRLAEVAIKMQGKLGLSKPLKEIPEAKKKEVTYESIYCECILVSFILL